MRSFAGKAALMGMGQVIYLACQWGMLIVLARLGGPEMVGRFALALAISAPVMLFSNLALRAALVTDVRGEHPLGRYLALRLATTVFGLAMIGATVLVLGYAPRTAALILAVALAKSCENLSDILYGIAQRHERFDLIATSMAARGLLGLLGMAAAVWLTGEVVYGALALALAWALVLALYDRPVSAPWRRAGGGAGPPRSWLGLAWSVLPLGVAGLLISLNGNVPRYVIAERFGAAELGMFAAMAYLVVAGAMLINVLGQTISPRLARAASDHDARSYIKLLGNALLVSALFGVATVITSSLFHREIMAWLYGDAFTADSELLVLVMSTGLIVYLTSCLGFGLTALRLFRHALLICAIALGVNLALCWLLAPWFGLRGVVLAWAISLMVNGLLELLANLGAISSGRWARTPTVLPDGGWGPPTGGKTRMLWRLGSRRV